MKKYDCSTVRNLISGDQRTVNCYCEPSSELHNIIVIYHKIIQNKNSNNKHTNNVHLSIRHVYNFKSSKTIFMWERNKKLVFFDILRSFCILLTKG